MAKALKGSSKRAQHQAKVDSLDGMGTGIGDLDFVADMSPIESVIGDFIQRVHANINAEKNMVTTGRISDISIESKNGVVNVMGNPWLIYQDRGVNGAKKKLYDTPHSYKDKKPPVHVFVDWIKDKKIFLTDKNDNFRKYDDRLSDKEKSEDRPFKEISEEQQIMNAAYAMREKVFQEGFKPREIYSKEIPQLVDDLGDVLGDFAIQQIAQQIDINPRVGGGKRIVIRPK